MAGFPVALAIALLAGGTGLQIAGQRQSQKAQQRALSRYNERLADISRRSTNVFQESLAKSDATRAQTQVDSVAQRFVRDTNRISAENPYPNALTPGQAQAPAVVGQTNARVLADELGRARGRIAAQAQLFGFSTRAQDRGFELDRSTESQRLLGLEQRGAGNTRDARLLDARNKGSGLRTVGALASGAGTIGLALGAPAAVADPELSLATSDLAALFG